MPKAVTLPAVRAGHGPRTPNRDRIGPRARRRQGRLLTIVLAPTVQLKSTLMPPLLEVLQTLAPGGGVDVMVDALGGATAEAWRVVSVLRDRFDSYNAIVPFAASPGATQVALGANALIMGEASSLAPIEPPRVKGLEVAGGDDSRLSMSAYDVQHYIRFLQRELAPGEKLDAASPALAQLWSRVDPLVVGATERAHQTNRTVTRRCLETHLDPDKDAARIDGVLRHFADSGLGHRFPITRRDCELRLGLDVIKPPEDLWGAVWNLHGYYRRMLDLEGDLQLGEAQHYLVGFDGFIDTLETRRVLLRVTRCDEAGRPLADKATLHRWVSPQAREVKLDEELEL